jgi:hypothetical protein
MNIFLDDIRVPKMAHNNDKGLGNYYSDNSVWHIARNYLEFVYLVNRNFDKIELISFDHDLACYDDSGKELTGKSAVDYLIEKCLDESVPFPKNWYVHSDNTNGRQNIIGAIINYLDKVEGITYPDFRGYHKGVLNGKPV